jgi:hypothetical protein
MKALATCCALIGAGRVPGACLPTLRIMFRDLSRPVCVVPISWLSALETCFPPLVQAS